VAQVLYKSAAKTGALPHSDSIREIIPDEKLPKMESALLDFFIGHADTVLSKDTILLSVWGCAGDGMSATLTVHINRLRKKLEEDARCPKVIETVRGVGYRFNSGALKIK